MVYISWIARQPVTNVNDSTYSIQVANPRRCGGGEQGGGGTQSLIRAGTRITRDIEVSSRCAGTYRGMVIYEPSLGPAGQGGSGLPEPGRPGHISRRAVLDRGAVIGVIGKAREPTACIG